MFELFGYPITDYFKLNLTQFNFSFFTLQNFNDYVLHGLIFSVILTLIATVLGLFFGTLLGMMRLSSIKPISWIATIYITAFRSIPLVMVILWFVILIPFVIGFPIGTFWASVITFSAFEAAYFAEIMRAGIRSIPQGQKFAGLALGMNYWQSMSIVILPQAFRNMLPILLTQVIILFQDTSLVYIVTGMDLLRGIELLGFNFKSKPESYIIAALFYFVICFSLSQTVLYLQKKIAIIR